MEYVIVLYYPHGGYIQRHNTCTYTCTHVYIHTRIHTPWNSWHTVIHTSKKFIGRCVFLRTAGYTRAIPFTSFRSQTRRLQVNGPRPSRLVWHSLAFGVACSACAYDLSFFFFFLVVLMSEHIENNPNPKWNAHLLNAQKIGMDCDNRCVAYWDAWTSCLRCHFHNLFLFCK